MEMESPVSFGVKEEPASPLWELELLDEVGGIWEGDVAVVEGDVDLGVDSNTFWGHQDISEFIGKEEAILGLELDEIILEDQDIKEGNLKSFYPLDNRNRFDTEVIGIWRKNVVTPAPVLVELSCAENICTGRGNICADPFCAESLCTDVSCREIPCTDTVCAGVAGPFQMYAQANFTNAVQPFTDRKHIAAQSVSDFVPSANDNVPKPAYLPNSEPFTGWLDSSTVYDGPNSTASGLPTFSSPSLWSAPESPSDDKAAVFAGGPGASEDPLQGQTTDLFREFEDVLSQAAGSLTPPDSPRSASAYGAQTLLQLSQNLQPLQLSPASGQRFIVLQEMASSPAVNDELDELMAETYQKNGGISSSSSSISSTTTKIKGRPWDSPSSSGCSDSGYDDPEWSPTKSAESLDSSDGPSQAKKRCLASTEERRLRKKEQNKNAATRYRMKKKMEMEEIVGEEKELLDRNDTLKSEVVEITREIKYLKGLMGDLFRAKGLIRAK